MQLNHLKYFYEVSKHLSFTKAAQALRISQPSLSKSVKALEHESSVQLFDRNRRSVKLTAAGHILMKKCETIFMEIDGIESALAGADQAISGKLSLGASDNICNYLLPPLFNQFVRNHPRARIGLFSGTSSDIKKQILSGAVELGLFYTRPKETAFKIARITSVPFVVVVRTESGWIKEAVATPENMKTIPLIGCGGIEYKKTYPVLKMLRSLGISPIVAIDSNSQETQKRMVLEDLGYAVLPQHAVQKEVKEGTLRILKTIRPIGADMYVVYRGNHVLSGAARTFMQFVRTNIQKVL